MKSTIRIGLAVMMLGALASWAPRAPAACNPRAALERAQSIIETAREAVERSPVREAKDLLLAAGKRLRQGMDRARAGDPETACRLAVVAEKLAAKAVDLARRGNRSLAELQNLLARTEELLQGAAPAVKRSRSRPAQRILVAAFRQQHEARRGFRSGRMRLALKLTLMARNTAERALALAQGSPAENRSWVEKNLVETDRLLEEAARLLADKGGEGGNSGDMEAVLSRARRVQEEARRHFDSGRSRLALQLTRQARLVALRALNRVDAKLSREDVEPMIEATAELVSRLDVEARDAGDRGAKKILIRASRLLDDARESLGQGRFRKALGSVRAASALALQVAEGLGSGARN